MGVAQVPPSSSQRPFDTSQYKVNFDGALLALENRAGFGVMLRNDRAIHSFDMLVQMEDVPLNVVSALLADLHSLP